MAAPTLTFTYPANNDVGIPVGISLEFIFDRGIDEETARNGIVMYGADRDLTSGPDQAEWVNHETGNNPLYLRSPGFKGLVPFDISLDYINLATEAVVDPGVITGEASELAYGTAGAGHKLTVTPKQYLAPDTEYNVFVLGVPDNSAGGIAARTVFDVVPNVGNVGTTGSVIVYGGYTRTVADTVVVEITTGGNIGTAKYRWYYESAGVGEAISGKITNRRYRRLEDGVQIKFDGSAFVAGDIYKFNVEPRQYLAINTRIVFTTNDGSYSAPPDSPSTPVTGEVPLSVLPDVSSVPMVGDAIFDIVEVDPEDRAYNVSTNTRKIIVTFSQPIDAATITDDTVRLSKISSLGQYSNTFAPITLAKKLTVDDNKLIVEF